MELIHLIFALLFIIYCPRCQSCSSEKKPKGEIYERVEFESETTNNVVFESSLPKVTESYTTVPDLSETSKSIQILFNTFISSYYMNSNLANI